MKKKKRKIKKKAKTKKRKNRISSKTRKSRKIRRKLKTKRSKAKKRKKSRKRLDVGSFTSSLKSRFTPFICCRRITKGGIVIAMYVINTVKDSFKGLETSFVRTALKGCVINGVNSSPKTTNPPATRRTRSRFEIGSEEISGHSRLF